MIKRKWIFAVLALALCIPVLWLAVAFLSSPRSDLVGVHYTIASSLPDVEHISAERFAGLDRDELIIFDTREADEFAVSHLPQAIRISPDMPAEDFLAKYGDLVSGKKAVFYCSVGARSSQYASQVQDALETRGAEKVINLKLGLFGWHNDGRAVVGEQGSATQAIHPYDDFWGRLLERKQHISKFPK